MRSNVGGGRECAAHSLFACCVSFTHEQRLHSAPTQCWRGQSDDTPARKRRDKGTQMLHCGRESRSHGGEAACPPTWSGCTSEHGSQTAGQAEGDRLRPPATLAVRIIQWRRPECKLSTRAAIAQPSSIRANYISKILCNPRSRPQLHAQIGWQSTSITMSNVLVVLLPRLALYLSKKGSTSSLLTMLHLD